MNRLTHLMAALALIAGSSGSALAGKAVGDMHPEEAYPDNIPPLFSPGPNADFIKQVQERLHAEGFDAGPVNGAFGTKTQAALVQFQLANTLPASGSLDSQTLLALGAEPPAEVTEASGEAEGNGEAPGAAAAGATHSTPGQ